MGNTRGSISRYKAPAKKKTFGGKVKSFAKKALKNLSAIDFTDTKAKTGSFKAIEKKPSTSSSASGGVSGGIKKAIKKVREGWNKD